MIIIITYIQIYAYIYIHLYILHVYLTHVYVHEYMMPYMHTCKYFSSACARSVFGLGRIALRGPLSAEVAFSTSHGCTIKHTLLLNQLPCVLARQELCRGGQEWITSQTPFLPDPSFSMYESSDEWPFVV